MIYIYIVIHLLRTHCYTYIMSFIYMIQVMMVDMFDNWKACHGEEVKRIMDHGAFQLVMGVDLTWMVFVREIIPSFEMDGQTRVVPL